nr:putative ribonuclease H-like domain-containing protein [Tanacetum cinerariifolium]
TKPLDSLKNWNNRFFWVDECVFPTAVEWQTNASKDGMSASGTYSVEAVKALDTHRTPIQKQPEALLCLVGISRRYYLGDDVYPIFHYDDDREMDLFSLIRAPNLTKEKTGSRPRAPHELPLLTLTAPRVIEMDEPTVATDSSGVPSAIERGHEGIGANAPSKSLRRDHADLRPSVTAGNQSNLNADFQEEIDVEKAGEEATQQYMLFLVWSTGSSNPQNKEEDAAFDGKEYHAEKPESAVNLSPSSSARSGRQDDMTKKKDKGKSIIEYFIGNIDFNAYFEDYSEDINNNVSVAGPIVPTAGQNYSNITNPISAAGPLNTNTSPTHGKSLFQDASQMLEREDITYSDHENVGGEADFNNLETSITVRFMMYQMVVKSAFLYGTIEEEVYVCQPLGFEDPDHLDKVYKVVKALYGLHQAPKAWYETLANYLLENGFHRGHIDQTLFIKKQKGDIMLVHIYVDDIIFGATNKDFCKSFEKLMKDKFQMSSMGELTFFLGLQVKQKKDGIFINQDKYVAEILKKFRLTEGKSASTPINTEKPLLKDPDGEDVDVHIYRSMIGSLMYLTSSRPDIMIALRLRFEQEAKLLKKPVAQVARRDKIIQARELEIKNLEVLLEAEAGIKRAAEEKSAGLKLERMHAQFSELQVSNERLSQQVDALQQQVSREESLKAAFEDYKRQQDQMVEQRCAKMDARLDAMSIDFDEELYPYMLTAITGRRWVIGYGLRLATMKYAESLETRQAFADVVSAGIAKGMSEGLKHRVEHGHAQRMIESLEAYDPEAEAKFAAALQSLKDLKLLLLDQLEGLKDAPMDVIMASLYLEDDTEGMLLNLYATSVPAPPSLPSRYTQRYATPRTLGHARKRLNWRMLLR